MALSITEKQALKRLIEQRRDSMTRALNGELNKTEEDFLLMIRTERGLPRTREEVNGLLQSLRNELKSATESKVGNERASIRLKIDEVDEEYDKKDKELKERHRLEYTALQEERKNAKKKLRDELLTVEENVAKEHFGPILMEITSLEKEALTLTEQEGQIKEEAQRRVISIRKHKNHIESAITDAANRALETLWTSNSLEGMENLVQSIPTIAEAMQIVQGKDGIMNLFKRLNFQLALPAPVAPAAPQTEVTVETTEINAREIVGSVVEEGAEEQETEDQQRYREREREREVYR